MPPGTEFFFVASYNSQGYGGGILTRLHTGQCVPLDPRVKMNNTYCKHPVHTSQETRYVSASETNRLMLFGGGGAGRCEDCVEHADQVACSRLV
jgi:hypothetical protein